MLNPKQFVVFGALAQLDGIFETSDADILESIASDENAAEAYFGLAKAYGMGITEEDFEELRQNLTNTYDQVGMVLDGILDSLGETVKEG